MRDYFIHEAETRATSGLVGRMLRWWVNWRNRKDLKAMLKMSDYQLSDVGLTRAQLISLMRLPLNCDFQWEMERLALQSRPILSDATELPPPPEHGGGTLLLYRPISA